MQTARRLFRQLVEDTSAATAIEYALIAALIAGALTGVLTTLGPAVAELFAHPDLLAAFE